MYYIIKMNAFMMLRDVHTHTYTHTHTHINNIFNNIFCFIFQLFTMQKENLQVKFANIAQDSKGNFIVDGDNNILCTSKCENIYSIWLI